MVGLMMRVVLFVIVNPQYNRDYKVQMVGSALVNYGNRDAVFYAE